MKILVVDDHLEESKLLRVRLAQLGHEAVIAMNGVDALEKLTDDVVAVVTDVDMPQMNGVLLAREIRRLRPDLSITFATGSDSRSELLQEARTYGQVFSKHRAPAQLIAATVDQLVRDRAG